MDDAKRVIAARPLVYGLLGLVCLLAMVPAVNFMAHAVWLSGHPVEGEGAAGQAWGRRADVWFGVLVVLVAVEVWCVWALVRHRKRWRRE